MLCQIQHLVGMIRKRILHGSTFRDHLLCGHPVADLQLQISALNDWILEDYEDIWLQPLPRERVKHPDTTLGPVFISRKDLDRFSSWWCRPTFWSGPRTTSAHACGPPSPPRRHTLSVVVTCAHVATNVHEQTNILLDITPWVFAERNAKWIDMLSGSPLSHPLTHVWIKKQLARQSFQTCWWWAKVSVNVATNNKQLHQGTCG